MDHDPRDFPPGDLRVSDAERDLAVSELGKAFQAGRLTTDEFEERCGAAFASRTGAELAALLADLPVERNPTETAVVHRPDQEPVPRPRLIAGATIAAACFALVAVANALSRGPSLQQRQLTQQIFAQHGITIPLPPAEGFNWPGTITPAIVSLVFVLLIVFMRATRDDR